MDANLLVILALVAAAHAVPISVKDTNKCSETCSPNNKFRYNPGTTYTYEYKVATETLMAGASDQSAKLTIVTSADVHVMSPCEFSLRLRDTRLMHSDATGQMKNADKEAEFRSAVESSELRFSFQDGVVDHICASSSDDAAVLNFKKGILSSFQNSMDDLFQAQNVTERDVAGDCRTEYQMVSNGYYSMTVKKTKDVLSCTGRHQFNTMFQMMPYTVPSELQTFPIMKTTQECEQEIEKGEYLKSSTCKEMHVYRPFSNGNSGGMTTVEQSLTYYAQKSESRKSDAVTSRDTLVFDYSVAKDNKMARVDVEQRLRAICETSRYDVRPESPGQFSELVTAMKSLSQQDLDDLYRLLKTKTICPDNDKTYKMYLDALPLLHTEASIQLMTSLASSKDVSGVLSQAWITSLGFVQKPSQEMLLSAKALIDSDETREDSLLAVSTMVNNYCRKMTSCDQDLAVSKIITSIEKNIGYRCDASDKHFEKVMLSLRALGNAGYPSRMINKCLKSDSNPLEIRVAAANAFRRMPCDAEDDALWKTYQTSDLDSELRVAAYLAIMRCPFESTLKKMAASLEKEHDDQVGAFVYSHLTNLKSTSDPHRQDVALAAKNLVLDKKFELSALRFSRNFETSILINKLNMGFAAESNLVWSSATQMPKSISGNLTVDLFGQAINMMDFGARMDGLEHLIRKISGYYLPDDEKKSEESENDDISGSLFGRIFGNEMMFLHSKTLKSPVKKMPSYLDLIIKLAKKQDFALSQAAQFMDVNMMIPTVAGLPINVYFNGTGTFDLVLNGKMDVRKVSSSPRSLDIDGEIRPSAAIEITGTMSVDAMVTKTGMRMRNTLHSSTAIKGRVLLQRGQVFNIELDTPQEKMEVFSAGSKFFILHNDMEQEQALITENRQDFKVCSGDKLATVAGFQFCGEMSFPNASQFQDAPYFPLTGPSSVSVTYIKRDTHHKYKIFAKKVDNKKASIGQISLNTPGSKVDRAIIFEVELNYPKQTLDATMRTPWKKATMNGATVNNDKLKSISGNLVIDDDKEYAFTSLMKIAKSKGKIQLSPMVEIRRVGASNIQLDGFVSVVTPFKAVDIDMSLSGISKTPYTLKSSVQNTKKNQAISASLSTDAKNKYTIEASHQFSTMGKKVAIVNLKNALKINTPSKELISLQSYIDYKQDKSLKLDGTLAVYKLLKKPANIRITLLKNGKKRGVRYDADVNLKTAAITAKLDSYAFVKTSGLVSTKNVLQYTIPKVAKNKITLGGKFIDRSTKAYKKYSLKSNLNVQRNPEYNLALSCDIDHKNKLSAAEVELKYGDNHKDRSKRLYWSTSLNKKVVSLKNAIITFKMDAESPAHNIDMSILGKHMHTPKSVDSTLGLNYGKGKDLTAEVTLRDKSSKLKKYTGKAAISGFGSEYSVSSSMDQKAANVFSHIISMKGINGTKHSMTNLYKSSKDGHAFSTKFSLNGMKPITLSGSTKLDARNIGLSAEFMTGKDAYGFKTNGTITKSPSGTAYVEVYHPTRRMTLLTEAGKFKGKYKANIETAWDADRDESQKFAFSGSAFMKEVKNTLSMGGELSISTPSDVFDDFETSFRYGGDKNQHDLTTKTSLGGKGNMITTNFNLKKPITVSNFQVSTDIKTPFEGFRAMSFVVDHELSSQQKLKTILGGRLEKEKANMIITGSNDGDMYNRNFQGTLDMKSTIKVAKNIKFSIIHSDGNGKLASKAALTHNGKPYSYSINMYHSQKGWQVKNNGELNVAIQSTKVKSSWKHKSSETEIKSTYSADWGKKHFQIDIDGSHNLITSGTLSGNVKIETPWKSMRNVDASLTHKHDTGMLQSRATLKQNGRMEAVSSLRYNSGPSEFDMNFDLSTPFNEDIAMRMNSKFSKYPLTGQAMISWAPKTKAVMQGSLTISSSAFDIDMDIQSPFHKDISAKVNSNYGSFPLNGEAQVSWSPKEKANVKGSLDIKEKEFGITMSVKSPFHKEISAKINSKYDAYPVTGLAQITWEPKSNVLVQGSLNLSPSEFDIALSLESPLHKPIDAKANSKFSSYPMTGLMELSWAPRSKAALEATLNIPTFDDANAEIKLTTPFKGYRNIVLKSSNKKSHEEIISNIDVNFGVRDNFNIESRINFNKNFRLKMRTPFDQVRSLNTGLQATGDIANFDGSLDFEVIPIVGKYQGNVNWQYDDALKGSLRVDTPLKDYPYFEVSTESATEGKMRRSMIRAEYYPSQVYQFKTAYAINHPYHFESSINSPFHEFNNLGVSFHHSQSASKVVSHGEVTFQPNKKIDVDLNIDLSSKLEGSLVVKTPFNGHKTNSIVLSHQGNLDAFVCHAEANIATQSVSTDISFKSGYNTEAILSLTSPISGFENVYVSMNKRGTINNARGSAAISVNGQRSQIKFNHKLTESAMNSYLNVNTPVTENFKITINHDGPIERFTNKVSMNYGQQYDVDTTVSFGIKQSDITGDALIVAKVAGSKNTARFSFAKNGLIEDLSFSSTASYNKNDISLNGSLKLSNGIESTLKLNTPFKNFRNLGFSVSHTGDIYNFKTKSGLTYIDNQSINGKMEMSSDGINQINFNTELSTPYNYMQSTRASLKHEYKQWSRSYIGEATLYTTIGQLGQSSISYSKTGDAEKFDVHITGKYGDNEADISLAKNGHLNDFTVSSSARLNDKSIVVDGLLKTENGFTGELKARTPISGFNNIGVKLSQRGGINAFHSDASVDYADNKNINGQVDFTANSINDIMLSAELNSPMELLGSSKLTLDHKYTNMNLKTVATFNEKTVSIDGVLKTNNGINGEVKLSTPIQGYRNLGLKLSHRGGMNNFHSDASVDYADDMNANGQIELAAKSIKNIRLSAEINTPRELLGSSKLTFNHRYNDMKLKTVGRFNGKTVSVDGSLETNNGIDGELKLSTPIRGYKNLGLKFSHRGEINAFHCDASVDYADNKKVNGQIDFAANSINNIKISAELNTPRELLGSSKLTFDHKYNDMTINSVATFNDKTVNIDGSLKMNGGIDGKLKLATPINGYRNIGVKFSHRGEINAFHSEASVDYADDKNINGQIDFAADGIKSITLSAEMNTPRELLGSSKLTLNHRYNDMTVNTIASFNGKSVSVEGSLKMYDGIEGELKVATPIKGYRHFGLKFSHRGQIDAFRSDASVDYADNKNINGQIEFIANGIKNIRLVTAINSPQEIFGSSKLTFSHKYDDMTVKTVLSFNDKTVSIDGFLKTNNGINGDIKVTTPIQGYRNIGLKFSHRGEINAFHCDASVDYADNKNVNGQIDFEAYSIHNIRLSTEINTPRELLGSSKLTFNHKYNDMTVETVATLNGKTLKVDGSLKMIDGIAGVLKVETPFSGYRNLGLKFSHYGEINAFHCDASVDYADYKNVNGKLDFTANGIKTITLSVEVNTPQELLGSSKLTLNHKLNDNTINTILTFNDEIVSVSASLKTDNGIIGDLKVETPIDGYRNLGLKFSHRGVLSAFHHSSSIDYAENKNINGQIDFSANGIRSIYVTAQINTPQELFGSSKLTLNHRFENKQVVTVASLNGKTISVDGSLMTNNGIKGDLKITTPFKNYRNIGLTLSHLGDINKFRSEASIAYKDNKNMNGYIDFTASGIRSIIISAELNTPRDVLGYSKLTINHKYDGSVISSVCNLRSDICEFGVGVIRYSQSGNYKDINVDATVKYNKAEMFNGKISNTIRRKSINSIVSVESAFTPSIELTMNSNGNSLSVNGKVGPSNTMTIETNINNRGNVYNGQGKIKYDTENYGSNEGSIQFHKEGEINDFSCSVTGDINNEKITISGGLKTNDGISGLLKVKTPFKGSKNVGLSFKHFGSMQNFKTNVDATIPDNNKYSAKLNFYKYLMSQIQTSLEVRTPFSGYEFNKVEFKHESNGNRIECTNTIEYGNAKKIVYEMTAAMTPNPAITVTLKTPFYKYEEMMVAASLGSSSVNGKINAGNGNVVTLKGMLDISDDLTGSVKISTPMEGFRSIGLDFKHAGDSRNFNCDGKLVYMDNKEISGTVDFKRNGAIIFTEIKTPFSGYEMTQFVFKEKFTKKQASAESKFIYGNNQVIETTLKVGYAPKYEMLTVVKTPFKGYEHMSMSYLVDATKPQYKLNANAYLRKGAEIDLASGLDISREIVGFAKLKTPITGYKNLGMKFHHAGKPMKFSTNGKMNYADGKEIQAKLNFNNYKWRTMSVSAELATPFAGLESTKGEIVIRNKASIISSAVSMEYNNGQKINGNMKMIISPNYNLQIKINTPFRGLRTIRANANADLNAPNYIVNTNIVYNRNSYKAAGKLNLFANNKLDGSLEIKTPIDGLESTKAEYEHDFDLSSVNGKASISYGRKTISAELKSTISPSFNAKIALKTPFDGYNSIVGSASYDKSSKKFETSSSLKVNGRSLHSMNSGLDFSVTPMKAFTKMNNAELVLTHEGDLSSFKCTGYLSTPFTSQVNADAAFDFQSLTDLSLSTSLRSSLSGMDNLQLTVENTDKSGVQKLSAIAGWTDDKQITSKLILRNSMRAMDFSLATPFDPLRSVSVQFEGKQNQEAKLGLELNGNQLLDVSGDYNTKDTKASLTFNKPHPMEFAVSGSRKDVDVYANWNRNEQNSNVRLVGAMDNNDISMSVEHNARRMGMSHSLARSSSKLRSSGNFFWNSGAEDQISYDLKMSETSRRNKDLSDASLRLSLPSRTLEVAGSTINSPVAKTADATFKWDADKDDEKRVEVKATMGRGDSLRGDVTVSMPSLRKQIRVDGELMLKNGRIILDSKTDFSYSNDARKTVTVFSKVKDISEYNSNNYSVEMGLKHPYTNIDVNVKSTVGSSDQKMTAGFEASYLTAARQTKNLQLLSEINKLKKQISLQMVKPMNIEIVGDISPSKVSLVNRMDNAEVFRSQMSYNADKSSAEISTEMNSGRMSLVAEYPSSKDFRAYISHSTPNFNRKEAVLAVHLNNSRLVHSRMAWRPDVLTELATSLEQTTVAVGYKVLDKWGVINQAIEDEIAGKYNAVSNAIKEELTPLIKALESGLNSVAEEMAELRLPAALTSAYRSRYSQMVNSMRQRVNQIGSYPIRENYSAAVKNVMTDAFLQIQASVSSLVEITQQIEAALTQYKENSKKLANSLTSSVYNGTYMKMAMEKLDQVKNFDVSPYTDYLEIPEEYTGVYDTVKDYGVSGLHTLYQRPELDAYRENINAVYQKGAWVVNYWDVKKTLKVNIESLLKLFIEIVEDELKQMATRSHRVSQPITYYNPEQGEVQTQLALPVDVTSLKELPNMKPLKAKLDHVAQEVGAVAKEFGKEVTEVAQEIAVYLPDQSTWDNMTKSVSEYFASDEVEKVAEESIKEELKKFKPSKKYKNKGGRKINKKMKKIRQ